ncbi:MAG: putative sulfate exporter family transporter [Micrococcales bacterium]|nr:putative sulfate exporter family transporter [Micrococcales bacterium]
MSTLRSYWPGLALAGTAVLLSIGASALLGPAIGALTVAILLGVVAANIYPLPETVRPGLRFCAKNLLRAGVVLLGLTITLDEVAQLGWDGFLLLIVVVGATFAAGILIGRAFHLQRAATILLSTGTAICGASAIAAMSSVLPDKDEEIDDGAAVAVASVTLYGTLALLIMPLLAAPLGLSDVAFGAWVGGSVHEVGQVVAAAAPLGETSSSAAIIVKLTRVLLLAPLVIIVGLILRSSGNGSSKGRAAIVPPFLIGFIALVVIGSFLDFPEWFLTSAEVAKDILLAAAMFGLGTGVIVKQLLKQGLPALAVGGVITVLMALLALLAVFLVIG